MCVLYFTTNKAKIIESEKYNYDNYNEQVKKMGGSDSRDVKVWWMTN